MSRRLFIFKLIKILFLNIIIFTFVFIIFELTIRSIWSIKHFKNPHVNYWGKTWYRVFDKHNTYVSFNPNLGSLPIPGFFNENIDLPRWPKNTKVSINNMGFRNNDNEDIEFSENNRILIVGDSFAFGDQVSNNQTLPSCIERKLKIKTDNGGVGGYGAAQSILRAKYENSKRNYSTIIWFLTFENFSQDLNFNSNFPTILKKDGKLYHKKIRTNNEKVYENKNSSIKNFLLKYSFVLYKLNKIFFVKSKQKDLLEETRENVSLKEVVSFTVSNFNKINKKKILVISYKDKSKNSHISETLNELKIIKLIKEHLLLEIAKYKIPVIDMIDSFESFSENEKRLLWFDHLTPKGNEIICNEIVNFLNANKFYKTEPKKVLNIYSYSFNRTLERN